MVTAGEAARTVAVAVGATRPVVAVAPGAVVAVAPGAVIASEAVPLSVPPVAALGTRVAVTIRTTAVTRAAFTEARPVATLEAPLGPVRPVATLEAPLGPVRPVAAVEAFAAFAGRTSATVAPLVTRPEATPGAVARAVTEPVPAAETAALSARTVAAEAATVTPAALAEARPARPVAAVVGTVRPLPSVVRLEGPAGTERAVSPVIRPERPVTAVVGAERPVAAVTTITTVVAVPGPERPVAVVPGTGRTAGTVIAAAGTVATTSGIPVAVGPLSRGALAERPLRPPVGRTAFTPIPAVITGTEGAGPVPVAVTAAVARAGVTSAVVAIPGTAAPEPVAIAVGASPTARVTVAGASAPALVAEAAPVGTERALATVAAISPGGVTPLPVAACGAAASLIRAEAAGAPGSVPALIAVVIATARAVAPVFSVHFCPLSHARTAHPSGSPAALSRPRIFSAVSSGRKMPLTRISRAYRSVRHRSVGRVVRRSRGFSRKATKATRGSGWPGRSSLAPPPHRVSPGHTFCSLGLVVVRSGWWSRGGGSGRWLCGGAGSVVVRRGGFSGRAGWWDS
ncbi:hypothetical protein [Microbispora corallina]|uniref:hypothetical protein n=1 Tax=Microbispora corallina TaxID=83302 RepID=UPI0031DF8A22